MPYWDKLLSIESTIHVSRCDQRSNILVVALSMGSASLGLPAKLGHYRVVEKIGAGGMGEVYLARDERLERDVAIKVLPPGAIADEVARKRFRKEALATVTGEK